MKYLKTELKWQIELASHTELDCFQTFIYLIDRNRFGTRSEVTRCTQWEYESLFTNNDLKDLLVNRNTKMRQSTSTMHCWKALDLTKRFLNKLWWWSFFFRFCEVGRPPLVCCPSRLERYNTRQDFCKVTIQVPYPNKKPGCNQEAFDLIYDLDWDRTYS